MKKESSPKTSGGVIQNQLHDEEVVLSESEDGSSRDLNVNNDQQLKSDTSENFDDSQVAECEEYDPEKFKNLNVSQEIKDLFYNIERYKPIPQQPSCPLKPFIPEYIPAIGDTDEFIKVPRPDGKQDYLGLKVLDEPSTKQSDPSILKLQLRKLNKQKVNMDNTPGKIEHNDPTKKKKIDEWVKNVFEIHKSNQPAQVSYANQMPEIEDLMQEWNEDMESTLQQVKLPSGDIDLSLQQFARSICALLDIPVYNNLMDSLHVLFTLYLEFKNNPFLKQQGDSGNGQFGNSLVYGRQSQSVVGGGLHI